MIINKPIHLVDERNAIITEVNDFDVGYRESIVIDTFSKNDINENELKEYQKHGYANKETFFNIIEDKNSNIYYLYEWTVVVDVHYQDYDTEEERCDGRISYQSKFGMDCRLFLNYFLYTNEVSYIEDDNEFLEFMASSYDEEFRKVFEETDTDGSKIYTTFIINRTRIVLED